MARSQAQVSIRDWLAQCRRGSVVLFLCGALLSISGCSLIEIESPAQPLPQRDLNARMLTRDYALAFGTVIAVKANEIMADAQDVEQKIAALSWKIAAATGMAVTSTHLSPMLSMLDTWTYVQQMDSYLRDERSADLFGRHRESVLETSGQLLSDVRQLARRVSTREEFARYSAMVDAHAAEHPMTDIGMVRVSLANNPEVDQLPGIALETVGTAAEAMSDVAGRLRLYTIILRYSTQWQLELYALQSGVTEGDVAATLERMEGHFADLAGLADRSPAMVSQATTDLDRILRRSSGDFERSALAIVEAIRLERELLMADLDDNWGRIYSAIDTQRTAAATDIERIVLGINADLWSNVRGLMREAAMFLILVVLLVLTLPFVGGYLVGRARARHGP